MVSGKASVCAGCSTGRISIGRRKVRRGVDEESLVTTLTGNLTPRTICQPRCTRGAPLELKPLVPAPVDGLDGNGAIRLKRVVSVSRPGTAGTIEPRWIARVAVEYRSQEIRIALRLRDARHERKRGEQRSGAERDSGHEAATAQQLVFPTSRPGVAVGNSAHRETFFEIRNLKPMFRCP